MQDGASINVLIAEASNYEELMAVVIVFFIVILQSSCDGQVDDMFTLNPHIDYDDLTRATKYSDGSVKDW